MRPLVLLAALMLAASCGESTGPTTTSPGPGASEHVVEVTEYSYSPATLSLSKPGPVELRNVGGLAHTWTVLASPVQSESELSEAEILVEARTEVGQSMTADLSSLSAGTYQVVCAIPGHLSAGMEGELIIADG